MKYQVQLTGKARRDLKGFDKPTSIFIAQQLKKLGENFDELVQLKKIKKLVGENDLYRLRLRTYRVIFKKYDDRLVIVVVVIAHRKEAY